jgi:predicted nuclease of predicted toxin-antitoxin system
LKLLFDANLAPQITKCLAGLYPGSVHVRDLALRADRAIWDFAASDGYVIVSKDSDFYHLSTVYGAPPSGGLATRGSTRARNVALQAAAKPAKVRVNTLVCTP